MANDNGFGFSRREFIAYSRREFIAYGSAGVAVAAAMPGSLFAAETGGAAVTPLTLAIGYWDGSEMLARISDWHGAGNGRYEVVDARTLSQGNYELLRRGVRLNMFGMVSSVRPAGMKSLLVRAHFNADLNGGREMVPFDVWSYRNDGMAKLSSSVGFQMPIEPESGLVFSVETEADAVRTRGARPGGGSAQMKTEAFNTMVLSGDGPKLRRGVYFLAPTETPIAWNSYEFSVKPSPATSRELVRNDLRGVVPADFPYVVMTVDFAQQ